MALRGQQGHCIRKDTAHPLHVCEGCESKLVYPTEWEEAGRDRWTVYLRCPNCEWTARGTFGQAIVDSFDQELDNGAQALIRDLKTLARANMADAVERFVAALHADAVLPEDF